MRSSTGIIKLGELSFYGYNVTMQLCEKGPFMFIIIIYVAYCNSVYDYYCIVYCIGIHSMLMLESIHWYKYTTSIESKLAIVMIEIGLVSYYHIMNGPFSYSRSHLCSEYYSSRKVWKSKKFPLGSIPLARFVVVIASHSHVLIQLCHSHSKTSSYTTVKVFGHGI